MPELVSEGAFGAPSVSDCGPARNAGVEPRSTLVAMMTCIERTYHRRRRRQSRLGRLTPTEFETIMNTTVALAARLQPDTYPCSSPERNRTLKA